MILSTRQRTAAHTLAGLIAGGEFDGATPSARCLLRGLAVELLDLADAAAALEERLRPPTARERSPGLNPGAVRLSPALVTIEGGDA